MRSMSCDPYFRRKSAWSSALGHVAVEEREVQILGVDDGKRGIPPRACRGTPRRARSPPATISGKRVAAGRTGTVRGDPDCGRRLLDRCGCYPSSEEDDQSGRGQNSVRTAAGEARLQHSILLQCSSESTLPARRLTRALGPVWGRATRQSQLASPLGLVPSCPCVMPPCAATRGPRRRRGTIRWLALRNMRQSTNRRVHQPASSARAGPATVRPAASSSPGAESGATPDSPTQSSADSSRPEPALPAGARAGGAAVPVRPGRTVGSLTAGSTSRSPGSIITGLSLRGQAARRGQLPQDGGAGRGRATRMRADPVRAVSIRGSR